MAYGDFKDLTSITASDKILHDKGFNIAKNPKYDGYQCGLVSMVYKFFDKKASGSGIKKKNISNTELAEELHKPIIRKFKKIKVHSSSIDNIWGADLDDMQLISKFNKGICFYYVSLIFSVNAHELFLAQIRKVLQLLAFQKILDESNRKPNKIWVDKGSKYYDR